MKCKYLALSILVGLTACGRGKNSASPTQPLPPSSTNTQTATAVSEVKAVADIHAEGSLLIFHNVDAGTPVIRKKAGQQAIDCASYLPEEEAAVNFQFGETSPWKMSEDLNTLTIGDPLTLFALKNMRRQGSIDFPDMPLLGVWEGKSGDGKKTVAEKYELQILLGKEGYEFHFNKICSAELKVL